MTEMWIARDYDGMVCIFSDDCFYDERNKRWHPVSQVDESDDCIEIDGSSFSLKDLPCNERRRMKLTCGEIRDDTFLWVLKERDNDFVTLWNNHPRWNFLLGCWRPASPDEDQYISLHADSHFQDAGYGLNGVEVELVSEESTPNPEIYYCQECWKHIEDTPDNMATGLGLVCDCGNDSFYTQEEMDEIIEAFVDPEIFPVSCETCKWNEWDMWAKVCFRVGGGVPCCRKDRYLWSPQM